MITIDNVRQIDFGWLFFRRCECVCLFGWVLDEYLNLNLNLNFIDNNMYIITKLLAPATSKMTNRGGGKGYTLTTREKLNTTN